MKEWVELLGLFEGPLNRLDRRGAVSAIVVAIAMVACVAKTWSDYGTLRPLLPVAGLVLVIAGGIVLARRGRRRAPEPPAHSDSVSEAVSQPAEPQGQMADKPQPGALPSKAAAEPGALPVTWGSSGSQFVIAGAVGGLLAVLAANLVFVYLQYSDMGYTLVQAQSNQAGRVLYCLPFTLAIGAAIGAIVGEYAKAFALYAGLKGKPLKVVTGVVSGLTSFVGTLMITVLLWLTSYN